MQSKNAKSCNQPDYESNCSMSDSKGRFAAAAAAENSLMQSKQIEAAASCTTINQFTKSNLQGVLVRGNRTQQYSCEMTTRKGGLPLGLMATHTAFQLIGTPLGTPLQIPSKPPISLRARDACSRQKHPSNRHRLPLRAQEGVQQ